MSGLFNRLKYRKTGSNNENEPTIPVCSFDEEGFLCPICHHKFNNHTELAQHYTQIHAQKSIIENEDINDVKNVTKQEETQEDPYKEIALWKQQFFTSEESRIMLTTELMQHKQRADDLEDELHLLQKHLKTTQAKVAEQSQEIANLKATKDVYDAQLAILTSELLNTQNELKEKQHQVITLCDDLIPRSTDDDVDVLKHELIAIQHRMDEMSLEKEQQIEKLRLNLIENYQYTQRLDQLETIFNQNLSINNEIISKNTSEIKNEINEIKQFIQLTHKKVQNVIKYMRNCLIENQQFKQTNTQLNNNLEQSKESNDKLINDLQKEKNSYRNQIELLTNEIYELEKNLNNLKEEKNQLIQININGDQNDERQNLLRQITQEKDQYEQQTKELRIQIKQINYQRQQIQDEFSQIINEKNQLQTEQIRFNNEIDSLKKQLDNNNQDKEQQLNKLKHELSTIRKQYTNIENNLREVNEYNDNQKQEIERLKNNLTEQINRLEQTKIQLNIIQKEKDNIEQKLQTTLSQLHMKLDQKENYIKQLSIGIRHSIDFAHKTREYLQQNIHTSQINLLTTIEKAEQESRSIRTQTLEEIHEEFTNYLATVYTIILDSKTKLEKQIEQDNFKLIEQQQQLNKIKYEYDKLIKEYHEQKQTFQIQLEELNNNLLKVSELLSNATQKADYQREKYEKQITSLEHELEIRTKKHEMQLTALTENLATLRSELKITHEKLANLEQIKTEKADIEARLVVSQDERHVLLERSLANENKNDKLISENNQLIKKNNELESALQEIAREYQVLQIQINKVSQRRWLDDDDVYACMKCNHSFTVTQRKHHCRSCGNIFCDNCSSKTAIVAAASKKPQRVCDQCYKDLTS